MQRVLQKQASESTDSSCSIPAGVAVERAHYCSQAPGEVVISGDPTGQGHRAPRLHVSSPSLSLSPCCKSLNP